MKRFWLGVILLCLLLFLGLWEIVWIPSVSHPIGEMLNQAAQAALLEDWTAANTLTKSSRQQWQAHWDIFAATTHHGPMEEIDSLFARAQMLLQNRATVEFSACCVRIGEMIKALGESHQVNLRNLL